MNYMGKMYTSNRFNDAGVEYIVIEQLTNCVALLDTLTNEMVWVTLNQLQRRYKLKNEEKNGRTTRN